VKEAEMKRLQEMSRQAEWVFLNKYAHDVWCTSVWNELFIHLIKYYVSRIVYHVLHTPVKLSCCFDVKLYAFSVMMHWRCIGNCCIDD
jgi:hypothetical protein